VTSGPAPPAPPAPPVQRETGGSAPLPETYVAYDADTERIVLVETTTGRVRRWLTPSKQRTGDFVVAGDHRSVYLAEWGGGDVDCVQAVDWKPFDIRTGKPTGSGVLSSGLFALARDGRTLAQVANRRAGGACQRSLVVRDTATGIERSWPMPDGMLLLTLRISDDGRRVAWSSTNEDDSVGGPAELPDVGVFDVARDRAVLQSMPPDVEHAGCARTGPEFSPRGSLLVIDSCEGRRPALLELDPASGRLLRRTDLNLRLDSNPFGGDGFVFSLSVDASGQHVLIEGSGSEVAVLSGGRVRALPGRYLSPSW
jgi:dipeptidyl aminopeptidase/acylaminoacyl peptidase